LNAEKIYGVILPQVLINWYQSTFLGMKCGKYFYFLQIYFFGEEKKKRVATFSMFFVGFGEILQKMVVDLSSSQKKTQVKKNRLKWSPRSQIICILKYAIFRVFSVDERVIFMISVAYGDEFFKTN
jgi:hypothetical protein